MLAIFPGPIIPRSGRNRCLANGGLTVVKNNAQGTLVKETLPLPYAGLMSTEKSEVVAKRFSDLKRTISPGIVFL